MRKFYYLFCGTVFFVLSTTLSSAQTLQDSLRIAHNDSIRKAHAWVDSVLVDGKYYTATFSDLVTRSARVKKEDLDHCESDSICKTLHIKREEAEKVEVEFPTKKLSGSIAMYMDAAMTQKVASAKFPEGDDSIDLKFGDLPDGIYKFKLALADQMYIFKLVVKTVY